MGLKNQADKTNKQKKTAKSLQTKKWQSHFHRINICRYVFVLL